MEFSKISNIEFKDGYLRCPDLHDGDILSFSNFSLRESSDFEVFVETEDKLNWKLKFVGVRYLLCSNIYTQNIISEIAYLAGNDLIKEIENNPKAYELEWPGDKKLLYDEILNENPCSFNFNLVMGSL